MRIASTHAGLDMHKNTFCASSCMWSRTRLLHAGWYRTGKLQGSRNVMRCDSRGKKSTDKVSKPKGFEE